MILAGFFTETSVLAIAGGFLLDLLLGDPYWLYHPVRLIGAVVSLSERGLRKIFPRKPAGELAAGVMLVIIVSVLCTAVPLLLLSVCRQISRELFFAVEVVMCWQVIAVKSLKTESMKVYKSLRAEGLAEARRSLAMIVGRDTDRLDEEGIIKAAVETVAENTSDGVVAPLCFLMLGGPAAGFFYKGINTLDSMTGYKNEKYFYFGKASARLDDFLNFIPARISALFMMASAGICGFSMKESIRIFKRDRFNHASPNSAQTEAAAAGALGIQLAGDAWYFGSKYEKETIGDKTRNACPEDIRRANKLLYVTAVFTLVFCCLIRGGILFWIR